MVSTDLGKVQTELIGQRVCEAGRVRMELHRVHISLNGKGTHCGSLNKKGDAISQWEQCSV